MTDGTIRLQCLTDGHVADVEPGLLAHVVPQHLQRFDGQHGVAPQNAGRDILAIEMLGAARYAVSRLPVGQEAFVCGPRGLRHYRRVS